MHLFLPSQRIKLIKNSKKIGNYKSHSPNIKQPNIAGFWMLEGKERGNC